MDTGVCNVNLANDAGYSSIMLVSLAEIKSEDEMKIVKRLFKCGDVNLQAKKVCITEHVLLLCRYARYSRSLNYCPSFKNYHST